MQITYRDFINTHKLIKSGIIKAYSQSSQFQEDFPLGNRWPTSILERMYYNPAITDIEFLITFLNKEEG